MRRIGRIGLGMALGVLAVGLGAAPRAAAESQQSALEQRVQELEEELALMKRKLEVDEDAAASKGPAPVLGAGPDGFSLRSADSNWQLHLRGYTQFDSRWFTDTHDVPDGGDTFFFRHIRPVLEGTLGGVIDFRIMPDFANSQLQIADAWANLRYLPEAQLQFGKYKAPVGLERLQAVTAIRFVERGFPTQLVPNRDLGVMLQGVIREGLVSYQLAWMNGVPDGSNGDTDANNEKDLIARVFVHPFRESESAALQGLGIGFATSYGHEAGTPAGYKTSGQQTFFQFAPGVHQANTRTRYAPQAYWYWGPVGLLAEWVYDTAGFKRPGFGNVRANNTAWQIAGAWAITGETESYNALVPRTSFHPSEGGWGAFELASRFSQLKVDGNVFAEGFANPVTQAESALMWSVCLNWYLNRNVKLVFDYDRTTFRNFGAAPDRDPEGVFLSRVQLSF